MYDTNLLMLFNTNSMLLVLTLLRWMTSRVEVQCKPLAVRLVQKQASGRDHGIHISAAGHTHTTHCTM